MKFSDAPVSTRIWAVLASWFGLGFSPRGPASLAALAGGAIWFLAQPTPPVQIGFVVGATVLGFIACRELSRWDADRDPQWIVIDEVAGVWLALLLLPTNAVTVVAAVVLFRVLDKFKPGPIAWIDARGGASGIMGDDLLAGLVANLIIRLGMVLIHVVTSA